MSKYNIIQHIKIIIYIIKKAKLFAAFLCFFVVQLSAQSRLSETINMPHFEQASLRQIFGVLKEKQHLEFSYDSRLLTMDSILSKQSFKGLCIDYLEYLFGTDFAFKETASHIIISYAPQRMAINADVNTNEKNRAVVSGYVRDLRTNRAIADASVYDKLTLNTSTLSDKNGYFTLDIKKPDHLIAISLNKTNYRDTSVMFLLPVEAIVLRDKKTGYYRAAQDSKNVFNNFFGKFFTTTSQHIQSTNLNGFFAYSPFQVSLTPSLSTHGLFNAQVVNKFSLNIIGGSTAGVNGTELAGGFNVNQYDMRGAQFSGVLNIVGGDMKGVQMAGAGNVLLHNLKGLQMAGVWNTSDTLKKGAQVTGGMNITNESAGLQLAGAMNISHEKAGSQVAGGINVAKKVTGIQLAALLNIADSSDYPIAVLNLIKYGRKEILLQMDESRLISFRFRSGGRVMYSVIGIGCYLEQKDLQYGAEFGLGAFLIDRQKFSLATELVQRYNFNKRLHFHDAFRSTFSVIPHWHITKHWHLYTAPSLAYSESTTSDNKLPGTFHLGGAMGVSFAF
ncbi:peptidase associated/transthyretin-like domain-containing protein [Sphingobacterium chuzhouense]|uniref:Carboxypeptidase-like regulatory domain-containing protein n=1 Tax=Sphingobacterium chuzhouense TaxID=1742264 RepID=A0ABR7XRU1_9SPHI|nr:hypothetical protein [Sphingobacterium chuzhouense]MBD1421863.1 hypothetical protein [Sphingobacterium chuzhouense]